MRLFYISFALLVLSVILCFRSHSQTTPQKSLSPPLKGLLKDCTCSAETISNSNQQLLSLLKPLTTNSTYFSVFHVALHKTCPFWKDEDGMCALRDCEVCECSDEEIPRLWRQRNNGVVEEKCSETDTGRGASLEKVHGVVNKGNINWEREKNPEIMWTNPENESDMIFVDLRRNPERFTGYDGPGCRRVWQSVYEENCFRFAKDCSIGGGECKVGACKEERVLYRVISGVHTSISMHIAKEYLFENRLMGTERWAPNLELYKARVKKWPRYVENLYFTFAVMMRALAKASGSLAPEVFDYSTGNQENDIFTQNAIKKLFRHPLLEPDCATRTFNESDMFVSSEPSAPVLLSSFKGAFRNISSIMDCVGCEKCRLWGKLQFLGVGTALRVLFEEDPGQLKRNEVIALINMMHKLSTSIEWVDRMEQMVADEEWKTLRRKYISWVVALIVVLLSSLVFKRRRGVVTKRQGETMGGRENGVLRDTSKSKMKRKVQPKN